MPQQGLVVFAKNKARVSAFYQQTLGLQVVESDSSHDLLRDSSYEVVVHSLAHVRSAAEATGGCLKPEAGAWRFRGHVVLDGWDPEGNIVQFKQAE